MKILSSADWHINLHKKKIPYEWQENRYVLLFNALRKLEQQCDVHVIAGDLFDTKPKTDDTGLLLSYLNSVTIPTLVIPGNHEATLKGKTFWDDFKRENVITNKLVNIITDNSRVELAGQWFQAFPYGSVQTDNLPTPIGEEDILVTHIRGEVPPHITAEYDFEKLKPWKLVLLGDLHFNHKYKDYPIYYPGSPVNTTFDRTDKNSYGVDIIDFTNINDYSVKFVDLKLPKLIRKKISTTEELVAGTYDHVVYEVHGSIDEVAKVNKSALLDKKVVQKDTSAGTLDLKDKTQTEELAIWLEYQKHSDKDRVLKLYSELGIV